jgi:hypothetical protein
MVALCVVTVLKAHVMREEQETSFRQAIFIFPPNARLMLTFKMNPGPKCSSGREQGLGKAATSTNLWSLSLSLLSLVSKAVNWSLQAWWVPSPHVPNKGISLFFYDFIST